MSTQHNDGHGRKCFKCSADTKGQGRIVQEYDYGADDVIERLLCAECFAWNTRGAGWQSDGSTGGLCERQRTKKN